MRKISEKNLRKSGVKVKPADLGRVASTKTSKVLSDVSKAMQETVKILGQISMENSMENSKAMDQNLELIKSITGKKWRVRITARDKDGLISELIIE